VKRGIRIVLAGTALCAFRLLAQPVGGPYVLDGSQPSARMSIAPRGTHGYVVVWGAAGSWVYAVRTDLFGAPIGSAFRVNVATTGPAGRPSVAADSSGNFVVVWDGYQYITTSPLPGIFGRRFADDGTPLTGDFRISAVSSAPVQWPHVATAPNGDFVVVWTHLDKSASAYGVFGRRFSSTGAPYASAFAVSSQSVLPRTGAVSASTHGFVVVWEDAGGDLNDVFAKRYDASGAPIGDQFRMNAYTTGDQVAPDVVALADGGFVAVWTGAGPADNFGVRGRRYDGSGVPLDLGTRLNTYTTGGQNFPRIAADQLGGFVVVWESNGQAHSDYSVFGQRLDASLNPLGPEFQIPLETSGIQKNAAVAASKSRDYFVVAYSTLSNAGQAVEDRPYALIGDANADGVRDVADVFYLINALFAGGPDPMVYSDVNHDGLVDIADVFYLINYLFASGPAPF
jgi:hypothetical protein